MSKIEISSSFLISESGNTIPTDDLPSEHMVKTWKLYFVKAIGNRIYKWTNLLGESQKKYQNVKPL